MEALHEPRTTTTNRITHAKWITYSIAYLVAIVAANLLVAAFGPSITIVNAFVFIGLDLTCRDALHDSWQRRGLWWKMATLIALGSAISWWLNRDAGQIAIASMVAFAAASTMDAVIYHWLRNRTWFVRANGSNIMAAAIDSMVFPTLAFGALLPLIVLGQFAAKTAGGFVWTLVLTGSEKGAGQDGTTTEL